MLFISYSARDCGPLPIPRNGSSVGKNTTFPNSIVFDCDDGFILLGSNIRNCQANGTWSGNQAFCEGEYRSILFHMLQLLFVVRLLQLFVEFFCIFCFASGFSNVQVDHVLTT